MFVLDRTCQSHGYTNATSCHHDHHISGEAARISSHLSLAGIVPAIATVMMFGAIMGRCVNVGLYSWWGVKCITVLHGA